jgi:hypothetical protein
MAGLGPPDKLFYMRRKILKIAGSVRSQAVNLPLTAPKTVEAKLVTVGLRPMFFSRCVLPGQDPYGKKKACQDDNLFAYSEKAVLLALFDGHGKDGTEVANACV